jgi:isopentenyl phosphate kinase
MQSAIKNLSFLKLGGSLITDKTRPRTHRAEVLARLTEEIAAARAEDPALRLVLGHGAGSFGHVPAKKYGTRQGVRTIRDWLGFAEVWWEADALNRLVLDALHSAGLPVIALPPSASVIATDGQVTTWDLQPLTGALQSGLLPVVFGDVVFDTARGGTILSTEDLFAHLARQLKPDRLLLAGLETGVWADYPACTRLIPEITPVTLPAIAPALGRSAGDDVTGGMASKVQQMLALVKELPGLEVLIFSGEEPGAVRKVLSGSSIGTAIRGS